MICPSCRGYGSALHEEAEECSQCKGSGVVCDRCGGAGRIDFLKAHAEFLCPTCSYGGPEPEPKSSVIMINIPTGGSHV